MENFDDDIQGHEGKNASIVQSLESPNTLMNERMAIQIEPATGILGHESLIRLTGGGSESPKVGFPNEGASDEISSDTESFRASQLELSLGEARNMLIKIMKERDHYRVEHRRVKVERDRLMCMFHAFQGI